MLDIQLSKYEKNKHLMIWSLITIFFLIFDPWKGSFLLQIILTSLVMLSYMFAYYSHFLFIFPKFYNRNNAKFIFSSLISLIIFLGFDYINYYQIPIFFNESYLFDKIPVYSLGSQYAVFFFIILVMALASFQNRLSLENLKNQNEKETLLLIKSLGFFKNQFNSHITLNFLNYCYRYLQNTSKEGSDAIELFSNMLRYSLSNKSDELVTVKNEIEYISNFITLQQHLNKAVQVKFSVIGNYTDQYIFPRILINFIENAFKHGETFSTENPINIKLDTTLSNSIKLEVKNIKKSEGRFSISTGIGNNNVKHQLELFYKNKYELKIDNNDETYLCQLVLST
jgi:two-component system LytT family sensor kinase